MDLDEIYDKFIKEVENEEFTKIGEAVGHSVLNLAEVLDKNITYKQFKNIIETVSEDEEINDIIDGKIQEELSKIRESEMER